MKNGDSCIYFFYIGKISNGGAERVMSILASGIAEKGYKTVLITDYETENEYSLSNKVERFIIFERRDRNFFRRNIYIMKFLRRMISKFEPDVIISFLPETSIRTIMVKKDYIKCIISIRDDPYSTCPEFYKKFFLKVIFELSDGCVFQNRNQEEFFGRKNGKTVIIPNPVPNDYFALKRNSQSGRIVAIGRLEDIKNYSMLLHAFKIAYKELSFLRLHIYGVGSKEEQLKQEIVELGIVNVVSLKGHTSDVKGVLSEADVFVLSSDSEGMPNALLEAMAAGIPCISTDCFGNTESRIIEDKKNGLIVPIGDEKELSSAILKLYKDEYLKRFIGENARKQVADFSEERVITRWLDFIDQITTYA